MKLFIDIHSMEGVTLEQVAEAHAADLQVQHKHGVDYFKYWFNEDRGKIFCLCTAPDAETANRVHLESTGYVAERIIEIDPDVAQSLLDDGPVSSGGAVMFPWSQKCDPGIRTNVRTECDTSPPSADAYARNDRLLVHVQAGTAWISPCARPGRHSVDKSLPRFPPQCAAGVGYFLNELYKACSRLEGHWHSQGCSKYPRSNSTPGSEHHDDNRPLCRRPPSLPCVSSTRVGRKAGA
jgi:hypothetical protein